MNKDKTNSTTPELSDPISKIKIKQRTPLIIAATFFENLRKDDISKSMPHLIGPIIIYLNSNSSSNSSKTNPSEVSEGIGELLNDTRNYLCHIKHKRIDITDKSKYKIDVEKFLTSVYKKASSCDIGDKEEIKMVCEDYGGIRTFTIQGLVFFLCLGLSRKYAHILLDKIGVDEPYKKILTKYCIKDSFKTGRHKFGDSREYTEWQLFCEIMDHISKKPVLNKPNNNTETTKKDEDTKKESNKDIRWRTANKYMVDYFILRWLELKEIVEKNARDSRLEIAVKRSQGGEDEDPLKVVPSFTEPLPTDDYYRKWGQYYCRLRFKGKTRKFKMHRNHLRTIAHLVLKEEETTDITDIFNAIDSSLESFAETIKNNNNGKHSDLSHRSWPRTWRGENEEGEDRWTRAALSSRIDERKKDYEKRLDELNKLDKSMDNSDENDLSSGDKANTIIWAMQHPLNPLNCSSDGSEEVEATLNKSDHEKLATDMCYYGEYNKEEFEKKVKGVLDEVNKKEWDKYIKESLDETLKFILEELIEDINLADDDGKKEQIAKRHKIRIKGPKKKNHWLAEYDIGSDNDNEDECAYDILWLPKDCFVHLDSTDSDSLSSITNLNRDQLLEIKDYPGIEITHKDNKNKVQYRLPEDKDKKERNNRLAYLSIYYQDLLLLEIAQKALKSSEGGDEIKKQEDTLCVRFGNNYLPIKYLGKYYIQQMKAKEIGQALEDIRSKINNDRANGEKPKQSDIWEKFIADKNQEEFNLCSVVISSLLYIEKEIIKKYRMKIKKDESDQYIEFDKVINEFNNKCGENCYKVKDWRNDVFHKDYINYEDIEGKHPDAIAEIDKIYEKLGLKTKLSTRIKEARDWKKKQDAEKVV